jgi:hypothetical protein
MERTFCTTNQECSLGGNAAASCALVGDFTLGNSYGTVPCNLCPSSQPIGLVTETSSSGSVGVCTCLQQPTPLQSCSRSDLSMRAFPDASQMCAVSLHAGASSRSVSALYDWSYLAACPCILISASNAYCYEVGGHGLMVVGHGVVKTSSSFSVGRRRRLLSSTPNASHDSYFRHSQVEILMQGVGAFARWNHTAEPCSKLVQAFVQDRGMLGVLDMEMLESCIHWSKVGQSIIADLNLTHMEGGEDDCC